MLHHKEEGIIIAFAPDNVVEVLLAGDFKIQVLRREVVVISTQEKRFFGQAAPDASQAGAPDGKIAPRAEPPKPPSPLATRGIYLCLVPFTTLEICLYLVNNTDFDLAYTLVCEQAGKTEGVSAGLLTARTELRVKQFYTDALSANPVYELEGLYFRAGIFAPQPPCKFRVRLRPEKLKENMRQAPLLNKPGYVMQADAPEPVPVDPKVLKEQMLEKPAKPVLPPPLPPKAQVKEVDLHIEKLVRDWQQLPPHAMLDLQLKHFEKTLDKAILSGQHEITFIHGAGNGTLKGELHKRLGKHKDVAYFKDAAKEKFGWGATLVRFK